MNTKKKLITYVVIALLVLVTFLGTSLAASADDGDTTAGTNTIMEKVAEIYQINTGISLDPGQLQAAFNQAHQEIREQNRNTMLDRLVENGVITEEDLSDLQEWLDSKPDIDLSGLKPRAGQFFENMEFPFGKFHGFRGLEKGGGFGGQCPDTAE